jgi:hypothetical protein
MPLCKLASPAFDPDSELAETIKVSARVHQSLIWTRQRQANQPRSMLREFYPAALAAFADLSFACWPNSATPPADTPMAIHVATGLEYPCLGKEKVVLTRYARNNRLTDALFQQAFAALTLARRPCLYDKIAGLRHRP